MYVCTRMYVYIYVGMFVCMYACQHTAPLMMLFMSNDKYIKDLHYNTAVFHMQ